MILSLEIKRNTAKPTHPPQLDIASRACRLWRTFFENGSIGTKFFSPSWLGFSQSKSPPPPPGPPTRQAHFWRLKNLPISLLSRSCTKIFINLRWVLVVHGSLQILTLSFPSSLGSSNSLMVFSSCFWEESSLMSAVNSEWKVFTVLPNHFAKSKINTSLT